MTAIVRLRKCEVIFARALSNGITAAVDPSIPFSFTTRAEPA
jgi:hypothetical protein